MTEKRLNSLQNLIDEIHQKKIACSQIAENYKNNAKSSTDYDQYFYNLGMVNAFKQAIEIMGNFKLDINDGFMSIKKHDLPDTSGKYLVYSYFDDNVWVTNYDFGRFDIHHSKITHYKKINIPNLE